MDGSGYEVVEDPKPKPPDNKDDTPTQCGPRPRVVSSVILQPDGSNYLMWRTIVPTVLDGEPYAWEVTSGSLNPPEPPKMKTQEGKTQLKNFNIGNKAARYVLFNSIDNNLALQLFRDNSTTVEAQEIWRAIEKHFCHSSGGIKEAANQAFLDYRYNDSQSASDNLLRYTNIVQRFISVGGILQEDFQCSRLLNALPKSWTPIVQGWLSRPKETKTMANLTELIQDEETRRKMSGGNNSNNNSEIIAMFSRLRSGRGRGRGRGRGGRGGRGGRFNSGQTTSYQNSEVVCFRCNQKGHIQSFCTQQPPSGSPQGQGGGQRGRGRGRGRGQGQQRPQANVAESVETLIAECTAPEINEAVTSDHEFVIDSGCSHNMVNSQKWFASYTPYKEKRIIQLGGSRTLSANGAGSIVINTDGGTLQLDNVMFVPRLRRNLISVSMLADSEWQVLVTPEAMVLHREQTEITAHRTGGLYMFTAKESDNPASAEIHEASAQKQVSLAKAHRTYAHLNADAVRKMLRAQGYSVDEDYVQCSACMQGKMHRLPNRPKPKGANEQRIGYIHSDVCSIDTPSFRGSKHFVTFTDDRSRFRKIFFIQRKDQLAECL